MAGKRIRRFDPDPDAAGWMNPAPDGGYVTWDDHRRAVEADREQAVAAERERIIATVEGLTTWAQADGGGMRTVRERPWGLWVARSSVLAAVWLASEPTWTCERCGAHTWVGHADYPDGPKRRQCVPCGWVDPAVREASDG